MQRVLVTGASGFLGKALVENLLENGIEVYAVVHSKENSLAIEHGNLTVLACAMQHINSLSERIHGNIDVCYHLAWEGTSGRLRGDYSIQMANVSSSCALIETCKKLGCKKMIFASTIMIYEYEKVRQCGRIPGESSFYSIAKKTAGDMMRILCKKYQISYACVLISNVFGPGEKSARLVNTIIRRLLKGEEVELTEGKQQYDFIYIKDAVAALYYVGKSNFGRKEYYIGSTQPKPLREYLLIIGKKMGKEHLLKFGKIPFDISTSLAYTEFDMFGLYKETGFQRNITFEEGIDLTIQAIERESY